MQSARGRMNHMAKSSWMGGLVALLLCLGACTALAEDYAAYQAACRDVPWATEEICLAAGDYSAAEMADIVRLEDGTLATGGRGYVEYTVRVPADALYTVCLRYFPGEGSGEMLRALSINGEIPFDQAGELAFSRMWNDADRTYKQTKGNQPFPSQVQTPQWRQVACRDSQGYSAQPLRFYLRAGENTLRLSSLNGGMLLGEILLAPPMVLPSYQEYLEKHLENGAVYAETNAIKYQAEDAALKSGPSFYPINDRTSPLTEPYDPSYIILNCIGDTPWNEPGEWIAWDIEAPQTALYRLVLRFKQSDLRGLYATRSLSVNGEIPFAEAADLRFYYNSGFQVTPLQANRRDPSRAEESAVEYWFYLEKGVNRIALEVTLGEMGAVLRDVEAAAVRLNAAYRAIIAITGTSPDTYQSYRLFTRVPNLRRMLLESKTEMESILARMTALTGSGSERTAALSRLLSMMDEIAENEEQLIRRLAAFKECIAAMGKTVLDFKNQPMKIDYFLLAGKELPPIQAEGNFFQMAWHQLRAFAGSFTNDYTVADSALTGADTAIDVWLSTGRDQFEVIRRLINEDFEKNAGVKVHLRLINADVLLPSTFTGNGPDVAIQISNSAPVNFAFRGAALDLTQFADYDQVAAQFLPAALESFYYQGGCYALPDQMSFPVLFYRKDILAERGLRVPQCWDDVIALIPELQRYNMEMYLDTAPPSTLGAALSLGSSVSINTVFLSRLYQTGGDIYNSGGNACLLGSEEGNAAFKWWTQFYTQHDFPRDIDFVTRFRLGEVPLGVVDLSTYTRLAVSAPEIRGAWGIAQVPGTRQADGTIRYAVPCVTGASMIIRTAVERRGTEEEAWSFLKWWVSENTQARYAREMEAILGQAGRYLVANLGAFEQVNWELETRRTLRETLDTLHGIAQVPGGYITGRYLNNAFVTVITDYVNVADTLYENVELINEEILVKRREFGLEIAE